MTEKPVIADEQVSGRRLMTGAAIFVIGQMAPLAIPLVTSSSLPATWKTALSGLLLLGVPEIAVLLTIVVLGRAGFNTLKSRLWGSVKGTLFPDIVSRRRYYIGLGVFLIPVVFGWLSPYFHASFSVLMRYRLALAITGDLALLVGICLMGGQFWDKMQALFVYDEEVALAAKGAEATP